MKKREHKLELDSTRTVYHCSICNQVIDENLTPCKLRFNEEKFQSYIDYFGYKQFYPSKSLPTELYNQIPKKEYKYTKPYKSELVTRAFLLRRYILLMNSIK